MAISDDEPTRLNEYANAEFAQRRNDCICVIPDAKSGRFAAVIVPPFARAALERSPHARRADLSRPADEQDRDRHVVLSVRGVA